ncbi:MAG: thiamine pyrophosphate-binding protein [Desulfobacteraceae bacterium]|nr:MAG: thiamine pyrophosphate-binding protein [Desulfobacteraceae bacterium]
MKGKHIFLETLLTHGVEYVFGNPGTTELPLIESLSEWTRIRYILALHESVAVGAANYYAQAARKTGVVNLHVAPGLGNGLGMLFNAYEAHTPLLITAGQQDRRLRNREPLLSADLVAMAAPLTKWSVQAESAQDLPRIMHLAFKIANDPPQGPVFLSLPIDVMEEETDASPLPPLNSSARSVPDPGAVASAVEILGSSRQPAIVCGDGVAWAGAIDELVALAEFLGAPVWFEALHQHVNFPSSHPNCRDRLPLDHGSIRRCIGDADAVLLVGGNFFEEMWYDPQSPFPEGASLVQLESSPERLALNFPVDVSLLGDVKEGLRSLLEELRKRAGGDFHALAQERNGALARVREIEAAAYEERTEKQWHGRPISLSRLMAEVKSAMPTDTIIVNETITASAELKRRIHFDRVGDYYGTRGGGIGQAMPGAIGVKLAHPDRPVIAMSGDGSAIYTIQALWTAAHHRIPVVWIIVHNRAYRILRLNMDAYRKRFGLPADGPYPYTDLADPDLEFVKMAEGFGVQAQQVTEPDAIAPALKAALESGKPRLIDVVVKA